MQEGDVHFGDAGATGKVESAMYITIITSFEEKRNSVRKEGSEVVRGGASVVLAMRCDVT